MRLLKTAFHPEVTEEDIAPSSSLILGTRHTTRAIVLRGETILLLYTKRYDDYSLPGGGIDPGENHTSALRRELKEETGATGIHNIVPFARYDEYRPWHKADIDIIHMISYCYLCDVEGELGETALESYEVANGMQPLWVNVDNAIDHNEHVIAESQKKGLSIERETFLLKTISQELLEV